VFLIWTLSQQMNSTMNSTIFLHNQPNKNRVSGLTDCQIVSPLCWPSSKKKVKWSIANWRFGNLQCPTDAIHCLTPIDCCVFRRDCRVFFRVGLCSCFLDGSEPKSAEREWCVTWREPWDKLVLQSLLLRSMLKQVDCSQIWMIDCCLDCSM
jgi:hypothetical protein